MRKELEKLNQELVPRIHKEFTSAFGSESEIMTPNMTIEELKNNFADILQVIIIIENMKLLSNHVVPHLKDKLSCFRKIKLSILAT